MNTPTPRIDSPTTSEDAAADWLVRKNEGLTPADAQRLRDWLGADPRHAAALAELETTWAQLNGPRRAGLAPQLTRALHDRQGRRTRRRRTFAYATAGLAAAAALVFALLPARPPGADATPASTVAVRPDRQLLPDGSVVELNAAAEIAINFSPGRREVTLLRGEALFQVAKDALRPFIVTAGDVRVRAVGTAFIVNHAQQKVDVVVTEGRVAVERAPATSAATGDTTARGPAPTYLGVGDRLRVPTNLPAREPLQVEALAPAQLATALAWRGKRVEFTATPVGEAVELLNRQNRLQLAISDRAVANLQLSGIFWADDPEGFVRLLESGMNVRAERVADTIILRSR